MEKQEKGFMKLKEKFTKEPILAVLNLDKKNENGSRYVDIRIKDSRLVFCFSSFI